MKESFRQITKIILFLGLGLLLLWFAFRKVALSDIITELKTAKYSWLILAIFFSMLAFISRARRWVLMIRPLGYNPSTLNAYHAMMTGYLVNFALPRLGEVSKCVALGRKEKIPVDKLVGTVIVERTFDLISMFAILFIMLIIRRDLMGTFLADNIILPLKTRLASSLNMSGLYIALILVILTTGLYLLIRFRKNLYKYSLVKKIAQFLKGVINGLSSFYAMDNKLEFVFHTIFIWLNYIMMSWVVVFMIPATSQLTFADATFIVVIGSLGMAAPVQGGIGAYHWIVSRGLHAVYNIDLSDGLTFATIAHESQLILIAILGTVSFYLLLRKRVSLSSLTNPVNEIENGEK